MNVEGPSIYHFWVAKISGLVHNNVLCKRCLLPGTAPGATTTPKAGQGMLLFWGGATLSS
jgi:hypothetical protein